MTEINYCRTPFNYVETHFDGGVSICCPSFVKPCFVGNFYESNSFDEIWNGEEAIKFRKTILDGSYKQCKLENCKYTKEEHSPKIENVNPHLNKYPISVFFCHDRQCNVRCIMCRDEQRHTNKEETEKLNSLIEPCFIPMLKDAKFVAFNGGGEFFVSNHMKKLAKTIANKYPHIKFKIISNGICFNKENCDDLGITDKIKIVEISLHATTEKTYNKIVQGGNFKKVMNNIKWLTEQKKIGSIDSIVLTFVVSSINYKEMPNFQKLANELGCYTNFIPYIPWDSKLAKKYNKVAIFETTHPKHKSFVKMLQDEVFDNPNCGLPNRFRELRKNSKKENINFIEWIKIKLAKNK